MATGIKTGGRTKGTPNKATAEIKYIARKYVPAAVEELGRLAVEAESEPARVAAIKEILDRAYGKATQALVGPNDGPLQHFHRIERVIIDAADQDAEGVYSSPSEEEV